MGEDAAQPRHAHGGVHVVVCVLVIFAAVFGCFFQSLGGELLFDDDVAIVKNPDVLGTTPVSSLLQNDYWGRPLASKSSHKSFRPLTVLTFRWNHHVHGLDPMGYHLVNLFLHALTAVLVTLLVKGLVVPSSNTSTQVPIAALAGGVLFAVHPVHTDAVSSVVGRADVMCGLFYTVSILVFLHARNVRGLAGQLALVSISVFVAAVAMSCKELGVTAVVVCGVLNMVLSVCNGEPSRVLSTLLFTAGWGRTFLLHMILIAAAIGLAGARVTLNGETAGSAFSLLSVSNTTEDPYFVDLFKHSNPAAVQKELAHRVMTYHQYYVHYAVSLLNPFAILCPEWGGDAIPIVNSAEDSRNLHTIALYSVLIVCAVVVFFTNVTQEVRRLLLLSLSLTIIPFLPAANIFVVVGTAVAERLLYIPSIGLSVFVSMLFRAGGSLGKCLTAVLLVVCAAQTVRQDSKWVTGKSLFCSAIDNGIHNLKLVANCAAAIRAESPERSIQLYEQVLSAQPRDELIISNLANAYVSAGQLEKAEATFDKALAYSADAAVDNSHYNRGAMYFQAGEYLKAMQVVAPVVRELERREAAGVFHDYTGIPLESYRTLGVRSYQEQQQKEQEKQKEQAKKQKEGQGGGSMGQAAAVETKQDAAQRKKSADFGALLKAFYQRTNPDKLANLPKVLQHFRGREDVLVAKLEKSYGVDFKGCALHGNCEKGSLGLRKGEL